MTRTVLLLRLVGFWLISATLSPVAIVSGRGRAGSSSSTSHHNRRRRRGSFFFFPTTTSNGDDDGVLRQSLTRRTSAPRQHILRMMGQQYDQQHSSLSPTTTTSLLDLRGGASATKKKRRQHTKVDAIVVEDNDDKNASMVVQKLRNVIRTLLRSTKSTTIQAVVKRVATTLESILGTRLLPKVNSSKSSKKKRSTKAKSQTTKSATAVSSSSEGSEAEDSSTTIAAEEKVATKKKKSTTTTTTTTKSTTTKAAQKHLQTKLASNNPNYRIQRELKAFLQDPPDHLQVKVGKNIRIWIVTMEGLGIYKGETFQLRIQFPANYPTRPPSVYFLPPHIPVHEHVYTNGDICLSLLGKDWRPTMTAQSIAHSILSILASAPRKSRPMDNARHAGNKPGEYQAEWVYHDQNC